MEKNGKLILTGWGCAEYVASAAVALKALGGREELRCDVRLVTATNRDLTALVREGKFREDLYQRLNVVQLRTPSMREHKEKNAGLAGNLELKSGRIPDRLEDAIRFHIRRVYEKYGQNLTRAAEALDVSRNTVRKYL